MAAPLVKLGHSVGQRCKWVVVFKTWFQLAKACQLRSEAHLARR
jgi:hypothetical protein